jgi:hypothetical protein
LKIRLKVFLFFCRTYKRTLKIGGVFVNESFEKAYSPKEMSVTLDIGDSTLRKWCIALENNGYGFIRNDQNNRVFIENDLVVLRHFQNLIKAHNMQLENASKLIIDRFGRGSFEVSTGTVLTEIEEGERSLDRSKEDVIPVLLEHIKKQNEFVRNQEEFNQELIKRLDQQQKYIDERLNERDRKLTESMRSQQEIKQHLLQVAAAKEEKKSLFARLFGK